MVFILFIIIIIYFILLLIKIFFYNYFKIVITFSIFVILYLINFVRYSFTNYLLSSNESIGQTFFVIHWYLLWISWIHNSHKTDDQSQFLDQCPAATSQTLSGSPLRRPVIGLLCESWYYMIITLIIVKMINMDILWRIDLFKKIKLYK